MIKYMYCISRRADLSQEEFHKYWLERHAPFIRSLAQKFRAKKYIQCHTMDTPLHEAFAKSHGFKMLPFDGITELWWDSMEDFIEGNGSPEGLEAAQAYLADEANFIDFSQSVAFLTEEHTIFDFSTEGMS